jgi:3'(2'), 5'-bisphosphate nucleotidase
VLYDCEYSIEEKEDKSPLTEADKTAHNVIVRGLQALAVQLPIL